MEPNKQDLEALARDKMYKNAIEYIPPKAPDADRVKELYYTSNQEGFFDRAIVNEAGQQVGVERTPGDIPQDLKDEYYYLINKVHALGTLDPRTKKVNELERMIALIYHDATKPSRQLTMQDLERQQAVCIINNGLMDMGIGGFNRQMSSTITQMQGQLFKVGSNMKNMAKSMYDDLRGDKNE